MTDNQAAFLDSFKGKTIQEILSIVVNVIDTTQGYSLKGQPETIEGYVDAVAGATQSSGRVILAIQDALSKIQKSSSILKFRLISTFFISFKIIVKCLFKN